MRRSDKPIRNKSDARIRPLTNRATKMMVKAMVDILLIDSFRNGRQTNRSSVSRR